MQAPRRMAIAATAAALLLLAACGSDSDGAKAATTGPTTTVAPSEGSSEGSTTTAGTDTTEATVVDDTTTTTESSEGRDTETSELDTVADGTHLGHIAGVENGVVEGQEVQVILFDEVQVLTGQEAIDAAAAAGVELDTDYYVSDPDSSLLRIAVAPDAGVTTLDGGSADQVPSSVTDIANAGEDALHSIDTSTVRGISLVNGISGYYLA